ncbi:MAG: helix-turn-helix transcriptional regulator [Anaerotignum sp.]|nr:helix-turn-helix transcriptional regulator [Anaerotignum sp.]
MSEFAKNLKKYRKMKNISQEKLGKSLNYGSTAIANYESGRNEPSLDSLIKIAEVLDVTIDDLLGMKRKTGEKQLLSAFKRLDQEKQQIVLHFIETLQF